MALLLSNGLAQPLAVRARVQTRAARAVAAARTVRGEPQNGPFALLVTGICRQDCAGMPAWPTSGGPVASARAHNSRAGRLITEHSAADACSSGSSAVLHGGSCVQQQRPHSPGAIVSLQDPAARLRPSASSPRVRAISMRIASLRLLLCEMSDSESWLGLSGACSQVLQGRLERRVRGAGDPHRDCPEDRHRVGGD